MPKTPDQKIREFCKRNNITLARLAADLGVTERTVYSWRSGNLPYPGDARFEALEAAKRAEGAYPAPGAPVAEVLKQKRREAMERARAARSVDWQQKANETQKKNMHSRKWHVCKRNYEEVRAAEMKASRHKIAFTTFYIQTRRCDDGRPGWMYEGRTQVYYFE